MKHRNAVQIVTNNVCVVYRLSRRRVYVRAGKTYHGAVYIRTIVIDQTGDKDMKSCEWR